MKLFPVANKCIIFLKADSFPDFLLLSNGIPHDADISVAIPLWCFYYSAVKAITLYHACLAVESQQSDNLSQWRNQIEGTIFRRQIDLTIQYQLFKSVIIEQ